MIRIRVSEVISIIDVTSDVTEIEVLVDGLPARAINYNNITGQISSGDRVVLNTTAVSKKLGTGGVHFVMTNLSRPERDAREQGHIMKMRYSPFQVKVLAAEEQENPYADVISNTSSINGIPVVIGTLHSMLPLAAAAINMASGGKARGAYIMTDGAALPLALSKLVKKLKEKRLIHTTITCGHAFGGDLETVNIYTALLAAKAVARANIVIVAMGPGIVGTGTEFGFTGIEQGEIINAVNILGGKPVAIPRISFADKRERNYGLSHHSRTTLGKIALTPCTIPLPVMGKEKSELVRKQFKESGILHKHQIVEIDSSSVLNYMEEMGLRVKTMGRSVEQDREFFLAAAAAGLLAVKTFTESLNY